MALINDKHKFIFFHLYKCGGMSLRRNLNETIKGSHDLQGGHGMARDLLLHFQLNETPHKWEDYFKFVIVRNPFDFMVSTFFYAKTYTVHFMHEEVTKRNMTMEEFIPYYMNVRLQHKDPKIRPIGSNKVVTMLEFFTDDKGRKLVDFIGRLENINQDLKIIYKKIGIPYKADMLKTNVNGNRVPDYRKYYTATSRAMIEKFFAKDLAYLKYEW